MKTCFLALAVAVAAPPVGLYRTAGEFLRRQPTLAGTDAHVTFFHRKIVVVNRSPAGVYRTKFAFESAWGYVDEDRCVWRVQRNDVYQLRQTADSLAIYSQYVGGKYPHTDYYFSNGLAGAVKSLGVKELTRTFSTSNPRFVQLLDALRWHQGLTGAVPGSADYRVVALYRQAAAR